MKLNHLICTFKRAPWSLLALVILLLPEAAWAQRAMQNINFSSLPGSRFEIQVDFDGAPPVPEVFMLDNPARLTMDFANVTSELEERRYPLNFNIADSVMILEAQGRTRMVVNLNTNVPYSTRVQGNSLFIMVGEDSAGSEPVTATAAVGTSGRSGFNSPQSRADVSGLDFRRGEDNAGQIIIKMARSGLSANVNQRGNQLTIEFANSQVPQEEQMRLDVSDFATPVQSVSLFNDGANVVVQVEVAGDYEYLAYQSSGEYVVNVTNTEILSASNGRSVNGPQFSGERIDLSFQSIEVRAVLQILADLNGFSLVAGDNVSGTITLELTNVPWDQALDLVLRTRGLDKRQVGNVLYVAPADQIAEAELQELQNSQRVEELAPLVTEYIDINYAVADEVLLLIQGRGEEGGGVLSERGRATVDVRTNTLIVQDVQTVINDVRALLARLDVPVRQVLIEARIVNASTSFGKALGIRWGGAQTFPQAGDQFVLSGSMASANQLGSDLTSYARDVNSAIVGGSSAAEAVAANSVARPTFPEALVVDLGVEGANSSIALGYAGNNGLLQLELSALEASGNGEVIAQPKVTAQDQQPARIESGVQIPYQAQAGGTAGGSTTEFVTAALSLEVTPQITPDGRIIMLLNIHQDSVVPGSGGVPAISTNSVNTRVLVNDGDTVVLGGVFREETTTTVSKTPLLGDLPYVGNMFKRTENNETKTELLIFITPSIINDLM